jgi:hypothetical protein
MIAVLTVYAMSQTRENPQRVSRPAQWRYAPSTHGHPYTAARPRFSSSTLQAETHIAPFFGPLASFSSPPTRTAELPELSIACLLACRRDAPIGPHQRRRQAQLPSSAAGLISCARWVPALRPRVV